MMDDKVTPLKCMDSNHLAYPKSGTPGPQFHRKSGTLAQFNVILGTAASPFSHENGDPCVNMGTPHAKIPPLLHVSEVKMSVALVYTSICYTTMLAERTGP